MDTNFHRVTPQSALPHHLLLHFHRRHLTVPIIPKFQSCGDASPQGIPVGLEAIPVMPRSRSSHEGVIFESLAGPRLGTSLAGNKEVTA